MKQSRKKQQLFGCLQGNKICSHWSRNLSLLPKNPSETAESFDINYWLWYCLKKCFYILNWANMIWWVHPLLWVDYILANTAHPHLSKSSYICSLLKRLDVLPMWISALKRLLFKDEVASAKLLNMPYCHIVHWPDLSFHHLLGILRK